MHQIVPGAFFLARDYARSARSWVVDPDPQGTRATEPFLGIPQARLLRQ